MWITYSHNHGLCLAIPENYTKCAAVVIRYGDASFTHLERFLELCVPINTGRVDFLLMIDDEPPRQNCFVSA